MDQILLLAVLPFFYFMRLLGYSAPITFMLYSWVYYMYISDISLLMCLCIPLLYVICVNVSSTAIFLHITHKLLFFPSGLVNWLPYFFPQNFISRLSTPFLEFSLLDFELVFSHYLVSTSLALAVFHICP